MSYAAMTTAIDASNYTGHLTPEALQAWRDAGVVLVIVQAVDPPAGFPASVTRAQIEACLAAGLAVDAYIWIWMDLGIADIYHKLALLDGLPIRRLWLDVEDQSAARYDQATCEAKVADALNACDAFPVTGGDRTGLYTGKWFWTDRRYMGDTTAFSDRDLWSSDYDGVADATVGIGPYSGWPRVTIKQHIGTSSLAGIGGIDQNALSAEELAKLIMQEPPPEPVPDGPFDWDWDRKKSAVVNAAGELVSVVAQLTAEANRKGGPRATVVRKLAADVKARADLILN